MTSPPLQGRLQHAVVVVEHGVALGIENLGVLLLIGGGERPAVDGVAGGKAVGQAVVPGEIPRGLRRAMLPEIVGGADDGHGQRRGDGHRHHVFIQALSQANAGIHPVGDDVGKPVRHHQLQPQFRMARQKLSHVRLDQQPGGDARAVDANKARGLNESPRPPSDNHTGVRAC